MSASTTIAPYSSESIIPMTGQLKAVTIRLDNSDLTIDIDSYYKPPISWFLTDIHGELILSGQLDTGITNIDLSALPFGKYSLRIAGEVYIISTPIFQ